MRNYLVLFVLLFVSSCSYLKPIKGSSVVDSSFEACPNSIHVFYKGNASRFCNKIVPKVDDLVSMVERGHGKPFTGQVVIHICDTEECFDSYTGYGTAIKAGVGRVGLFLSPKVFEKDDYLEFTAHELSHLHLFQQISQVHAYLIPQWFHEGLATYVSHGGGAGGVSVDEATNYLMMGKCIVPIEKASILGQRWSINYKESSDYVFQQRMNYRQSALFVEFLDNEGKLQALLREIESGNNFSDSFEYIYNETIQSSWATFVSKIKS